MMCKEIMKLRAHPCMVGDAGALLVACCAIQEQARKVFALMDSSGNGKLTGKEVRAYIKAIVSPGKRVQGCILVM